jgi:hypothetical protein
MNSNPSPVPRASSPCRQSWSTSNQISVSPFFPKIPHPKRHSVISPRRPLAQNSFALSRFPPSPFAPPRLRQFPKLSEIFRFQAQFRRTLHRAKSTTQNYPQLPVLSQTSPHTTFPLSASFVPSWLRDSPPSSFSITGYLWRLGPSANLGALFPPLQPCKTP